MSEEAEEQQNAWHDDFTTASQWEIFIAKLEEAIYDWKLPQFKASNAKTTFNYNVIGDLKREESNIFFSDVEFIVTHFHRPIEESAQDEESASSPILDEEEGSWGQELIDADILDETGDGDGPHPIERWYGIHHFLVLAPAKSSSAINSESQAKLLLSSAQIAISNSRCPIPIFVQLREPRHFFFIGAWEGPGVRTEFNMVHLRNVPRHCRYLTGLLDVFKGKLSSSTTSPSHSLVSPVQVSARLRFCLKDWPMNLWTQLPPDLDLLHGQVGVEHIGRLPFGAEADPISELHLLAQWRCLPESVLVDRDGYSDLAPTLASRWSLRAILAPPRHGLLTTTLSRILSLCTSSATLHQLLGDLVVSSQDPSDRLAESLSLLTETRVPSFSKLVSGGRKSKTSTAVTGPIPHQMLMAILYFLFPDAEENQSHPYPESFECEEPKSLTFKPNERISAQMKSAPCDSLLWRLAIVTGLVVDSAHGGLKAGAHLWHELAQEMRYRWEHSISIPGLSSGYPDLRSCLLYQKLQMLNYCVERRQEREKRARGQPEKQLSSDIEFEDVESSEDEDEFFECGGDEPERKPRQQYSLWNQPEGRLNRHGNLKLIETGDPLYIPVTQEPPPKTEDQRHEDAEVLIQLGSDAAGSELRAQLMSPLLLSDMEAFKAANPGACLGDFVRWYSPRDWIEEENKMSARMLIEGNTWQELWTAAKPVQAARQKRLFDDTREAEKVLHFLESRKPADAFQLLLPVLLHAIMARLEEEWREELSPLSNLTNLQEKASRMTHPLAPSLQEYQRFVVSLSVEETRIAQLTSLKRKFCESSEEPTEEMLKFLCDLLQPKEVEVPGGPTGSFGAQVKSMFLQAQRAAHLIPEEDIDKSDSQQSQAFPSPNEREFLLRVKACVPSPSSTPSSQRMYASIRDDSFRLAAAFSHDTIFV